MILQKTKSNNWERSGSVVECLTRDRGAAGSSLIGNTALCPLARCKKFCLGGFENNTGADQPAHTSSLISTSVIHLFESIIF